MTNDIKYDEIMHFVYGGKMYGCSGSNYEDITWMEENESKPTKEHLDSLWDSVPLELKRNSYINLRKAAYMELNQDELRFDDLVNGTTTWQDAILAIKSKYPKGE